MVGGSQRHSRKGGEKMDKPVWNPTVTRVREWYLAQDAHSRYWKCNVAYVCLDDVVLARVMVSSSSSG